MLTELRNTIKLCERNAKSTYRGLFACNNTVRQLIKPAVVVPFWENVSPWISSKLRISFIINQINMLFDIGNSDATSHFINFIIMRQIFNLSV